MFQLKNKLTLLVIACFVAVVIFFRFTATNQQLQTLRLHETSRQLLEASDQHYKNFIYSQISEIENDCKRPEFTEKATPAYYKADSIYQILEHILRTADSAEMQIQKIENELITDSIAFGKLLLKKPVPLQKTAQYLHNISLSFLQCSANLLADKWGRMKHFQADSIRHMNITRMLMLPISNRSQQLLAYSQFKNSLLCIASSIIEQFNAVIGCRLADYDVVHFMTVADTKRPKVGETITIKTALAFVSNETKSEYFIYGEKQKPDISGVASKQMRFDKPGRFIIPTSISYRDPDTGQKKTITQTIDIEVMEE
jgi:hypothetical protein